MKRILIGIVCLLVSAYYGVSAQQSGHIPPGHSHRTGGYGICYGYAMGRAGNAPVATCDPATIAKEDYPENESENLEWGVNTQYWTYYPGSSLEGIVTGDIVAFGTAVHVAYASLATTHPSGGYIIQVDDILNWGAAPTTGNSLERVGSAPNITYERNSSLTASGYYRIKTLPVTAQNRFYNGPNPVTDKGTIQVAFSSGQSPKTIQMSWNEYGNTATATDNQNYPTGYKQKFNAQFGWTQGGANRGYTLQIPIEAKLSQSAYQANFYQAVGVTFTPSGGGGGITVDGQTRYTSYTQYVRLNPTPAGQASATAVNTYNNGINYTFKYWTNSGSSDTSYSYSVSYTPSGPITWTAHFNAKPTPPNYIVASGTEGNPIHLTWTDNPNANVTQYQIWSKIKPLGGQEGSPTLIGTVNKGVQSFYDSYYWADTYEDIKITYDVRAYYSVNGAYADQNWSTTAFAYNWKIADGSQDASVANEIPTEFAVSSYPNPFNPSTTLRYALVEDAKVSLTIYDMMGREVATLVHGEKSAGYHSVQWNGTDANNAPVATGAYIYRLIATPYNNKQPIVLSGKLLLTK